MVWHGVQSNLCSMAARFYSCKAAVFIGFHLIAVTVMLWVIPLLDKAAQIARGSNKTHEAVVTKEKGGQINHRSVDRRSIRSPEVLEGQGVSPPKIAVYHTFWILGFRTTSIKWTIPYPIPMDGFHPHPFQRAAFQQGFSRGKALRATVESAVFNAELQWLGATKGGGLFLDP